MPCPILPPGILSIHDDEYSIIGPQNIPNPQKDRTHMNNFPICGILFDGHISPKPTLSDYAVNEALDVILAALLQLNM